MKRIALAILLVTAVAASAFAVLNRPGADASPDTVITVNSTADVDSRDAELTLREAMLLATGVLDVSTLTEDECGQLSGAGWVLAPGVCVALDPPGSVSADTIVFDPAVFPEGSPATISLGSALHALDTGMDTVDGTGAGVIVDGGGQNIDCFEITSDYNAIKGLEISGCATGVRIHGGGQGNTVEDNVVSGNSDVGVWIGPGANGNVVTGNYVGTDASGTAAVPNQFGVYIDEDAQNNTVGGSTAEARNVISGNDQNGVTLRGADNNNIQGNYIGTDASGNLAVPNGTGVAIWPGSTGAQNNMVGGSSPGEGNTIAFNTSDGIRVLGGTGAPTIGNTIRGNSIHSNGSKGIELGDGGNTELAAPTIAGFGSVSGTACSNCTIDVYSDQADEGEVYEGFTTADAAGNWSYTGAPQGPNVTATATDSAGNTSEFSNPAAVPASATRTLVWGPGWHNAVWTGDTSTPEDAFSCADGSYAAAYRYTASGWESYLPDRPTASNMTSLAQYDTFLILITASVNCEMPVAAAPGTSRTLQWSAGWQNAGWTGADSTTPESAFACADGSYAAAYRYGASGWEKYLPGRPDISDMTALNQYDAFLILVTAAVSCSMPIAP
ncbi:MAG: hypothetical protein ACUVX1_12555 [Chloroflexota bacterium]